jgi:hypothetical protein
LYSHFLVIEYLSFIRKKLCNKITENLWLYLQSFFTDNSDL